MGAWFRRGLPDGGAEPPADGKETCDRGPNEWNSYDCWGKCIAEDLVSAEGRQMIIDVVTSAAAEISGFFAVEPVDGNLVFAESTSRYSRALILKGTTTPACARPTAPRSTASPSRRRTATRASPPTSSSR